ncbi:MAG TPA: C45 family peptidase [Terriglobales bacterium]|nr:C45 family peptidase [Terriglobales bacterium]
MLATVRFTLLLASVMVLGIALCLLSAAGPAAAAAHSKTAPDPRLGKAYRFERDGWIYLHLEGSPQQLGFQHGFLLAPEIQEAFEAVKYEDTYRTKRDWKFFRHTAEDMLWPHIDSEYQDELTAIAAGLKARSVPMDVWDVVALNAFEEIPDYYIPWLNRKEKVAHAPRLASPGNCSAFVATGSYTRNGQIVMAHNNWTGMVTGARWRIVFDIVPSKGYHILMDGFPGVITSDDDFGVNSAGIMITETTITQFNGWDPAGKPEFMRSRKALQYASSIDEYSKIMVDGNNGGYANDWLIADRKTGEIAQLELGLKHWKLWRTKDGYFAGSNWARDPELIKDETNFDPDNPASSPNARKARWEELLSRHKGKIDVPLAQQFLSDHHDTFEKKEEANERTLCGHSESSPRGVPEWEWEAYHPGGAVQGKAMDADMARNMSFTARRGHPCGEDFLAGEFLKQHPEFAWQKPVLIDLKAGPWTEFKAGDTR